MKLACLTCASPQRSMQRLFRKKIHSTLGDAIRTIRKSLVHRLLLLDILSGGGVHMGIKTLVEKGTGGHVVVVMENPVCLAEEDCVVVV